MKKLATTLLALGLPIAALAQNPSVDGICTDAAYTPLANNDQSTNGFGSGNTINALRFYTDGSTLFLCTSGQLEGNGNGFFLFMDATGYDGIAAGTPLPNAANGFFQSAGGTILDMPADFGFFVNVANTPAQAYTNAVRYGTSSVENTAYLGSTDASGTPGTLDGTLLGGTGTITQTFSNLGTGTTGWEIAIPFTALPGVTNLSTATFFAGIAGSDAYFSNELLPDIDANGTGTAAPNFGYDPDFFGAATTAGGDLFINPYVPLPVELVSFTAAANGRSARLAWVTASETNNAGFTVERQTGETWTEASGLIAGAGTTTERQSYSFSVGGLTAGTHVFRLRQTDTDGTVHYSAPTSVEIGVSGEGALTLLGSRAVRIETNAAQAVRVSVVDVLGRTVAMQSVAVDGTVEVSLPSLASGTYFVRAQGERFSATKTLVVR